MGFIAELTRRNVVRVAAAHVVASGLVRRATAGWDWPPPKDFDYPAKDW
jgi:hypothetical protein